MKPESPIEKAILENGVGMFAICDEKEGVFEYWIAGLYQGGEVPEGLKLYSFPESNWAMFLARGSLPGSLQTLNTQVWQEWYPNEGQKYMGNGNAMLDENSFDAEQEGQFLAQKTASDNEIEIVAFVDGKVVGTAGIDAVSTKYKVRHRTEFGISLLKKYWGLGIGRALTEACIKCAREAGYVQLELTVVAENERAIALYKSVGFVEYGRNPRGFLSRTNGFQKLVYMLMEL